ncbi:MAG: glycosyltransferase family 4 protein [Candidatus Levyibacteriota bacterium]
MNILIFNWRDLKHSWAGGGEIYIFEIAKRWVKLGNSVTIFCAQDIDRKLPRKETYNGITVMRMGNRFSVYIWAIIFYLFQNKEKFDFVVDVENGIPFFTPIFINKPKLCIVYHVHGRQFFFELPFPLNYVGYLIEQFIFPFIYSRIPIIAISKTTRDELTKLGFQKKNIHIVYSGINNKKDYKKKNKKAAYPTILYLGRIKAYKRIDLLVDIFPKILQSIPTAHLLIAGWGTEASSLTDSIMKGKYRKRIKILGPVGEGEKRYLLSKAWVFVNPSIGEGWSISVIEANLHRTPAVAFRVPGLSESIKNKKTGFLVKTKEEFIEKIYTILNNRKLREMLSKNSQEWAKRFDWNNAAKKSLQVIHLSQKGWYNR